VLAVPNHGSVIAQRFKVFEDVPRHLYSFSVRTLTRYCAENDFQIERIATYTSPSDVYYKIMRTTLALAASEQSDERVRICQTFWSDKKREREYTPTARFFDEVGLGVNLKVVARKIGE